MSTFLSLRIWLFAPQFIMVIAEVHWGNARQKFGRMLPIAGRTLRLAAVDEVSEAVGRTSTSTPTSVEALRRAADPDYEPPMFDLRSRHWRGAWWPWWRPCVAPAADAYDKEP